LLPTQVPHSDAARNAGRSALLVHALTAAPWLLLPATADWLHQPKTAALLARLRDSGIPAVVSGAGPSVAAFTDVDLAGDLSAGWTLHPLAVDTLGAVLTPLSA
jgi:homoserine kinase